jgi:hypothetical protein
MSDNYALDRILMECLKAWIDSEHTSLTSGATHYVNLKLVKAPPWAATMEQTAVIAQHTFYKEKTLNA